MASLESLGRPLLIGASRKSFLGSLLAVDGKPRAVGEREFAHAALVALLAQRAQIQKRVYSPQQMIRGHVLFQVKAVEEPFLIACLLAHHSDVPPSFLLSLGHRARPSVQQSFSTESGR